MYRLLIPLMLMLSACAEKPKQAEMSLMSYNVYYNFNYDKSIDQAIEFIRAESPDILTVQEMKMPVGRYAELAQKWGHPYMVRCRDDYPLMSVAVSSRYPIELVEKRNAGMYHGYVHCVIRDIHIVATHFSAAKEEEKIRDAKIVADVVRPLIAAGKPVAVTGDLNSVPGSEPLQILLNTGLQTVGDNTPTCHAALYPDNPAGTGIKIDHILVSPALVDRCGNFRVNISDETRRISDHYPLQMNIKP